MRPHPLAGKGIVITRPQSQAELFAAQLEALGATPIIFPCIAIVPTESAALKVAQARINDYDYVIFVSANAVANGLPHMRLCVPALAPGRATAAALAAKGVDNVLVPQTSEDSEGLLALTELQQVKGKRVLIFRGEGGRELLRDTLRTRGAEIDCVACYRRVRAETSVTPLLEAWRAKRVDAVSATSIDILESLLALLGDEGRGHLASTPLFVPHPRIAERAERAGLSRVVSTGSGEDGLIAGLLHYFSHLPH